MAAPTFASEPGSCRLDGGRLAGNFVQIAQRVLEEEIFSPPVEPRGRGTWIEPGGGCTVLLVIHEHVKKAVSNLARPGEFPRMIALFPHATAAAKGPIDGPRKSNREAAHSARKARFVVRLHDEVDVIALDGEVHDAKFRARCVADTCSYGRKYGSGSQDADFVRGSHGDMNGMRRLVQWASAMGHTRFRVAFPPRASPPPTP